MFFKENVFNSLHILLLFCRSLGLSGKISAQELPLIQEITTVLREWHIIWKDIYVVLICYHFLIIAVFWGWGEVGKLMDHEKIWKTNVFPFLLMHQFAVLEEFSKCHCLSMYSDILRQQLISYNICILRKQVNINWRWMDTQVQVN